MPKEHPVQIWICVFAVLRACAWVVGIGVALRFTKRGLHAPIINAVLGAGFALTTVNGLVLGLNTGHVEVAPWLVGVATVLSLPSAILIVGAFILRVHDSIAIRAALEAEATAEINSARRGAL